MGMCLFSRGSFAGTNGEVEGFFEVEPGVSLYAHVIPGAPSGPVLVLLNGLTQDTEHWKTALPFLQKMGATIVEIDLALQGQSMDKRLKSAFTLYNPVLPPLFMKGGLWNLTPTFPAMPITKQSLYVSKILKKLGVTKPVTLLGLSYGGGLALQMAADFPEQIRNAVLSAPYAFPLPDQDSSIRQMCDSLRTWVPMWRLVPYDDLYDLILRGLVISTYHLAEPEVLKWDPPFQSIAASELVRGIRHMSYKELFKRLRVPIHLVIAGKDQYIPRDKLDEFWAQVPESVKGSFLEIVGAEHKMNESVGAYLASWAYELATKQDYERRPGQFIGEPASGVATEVGGQGRVVKLEKVDSCQALLTDTKPVSMKGANFYDWIRANPLQAAQKMILLGNPQPIGL
jgi:pimeloyl-ACP methyl ester carboxylesterase